MLTFYDILKQIKILDRPDATQRPLTRKVMVWGWVKGEGSFDEVVGKIKWHICENCGVSNYQIQSLFIVSNTKPLQILRIYWRKLTFLHLARAIIVIRFPGMPISMNKTQQIDAKFIKTGENPMNNCLCEFVTGNEIQNLNFC